MMIESMHHAKEIQDLGSPYSQITFLGSFRPIVNKVRGAILD